MENLNSLIGKRVNVDLIRTEIWQSEKYIRNGIVNRITEDSRVVVYCDDKSENSILFTGGYLSTSSYKIELVNGQKSES